MHNKYSKKAEYLFSCRILIFDSVSEKERKKKKRMRKAFLPLIRKKLLHYVGNGSLPYLLFHPTVNANCE